jgi:DNA-binding CsgD family transcriptional regulator
MRPSLIAGCLNLYEGRLERARTLLEELRRRVIDRAEEADLSFVSANLSWTLTWAGELALAAERGDEAVAAAERVGGESLFSNALAFAALARAYQGEAAGATERAERVLELVRESGWEVATVWAAAAIAVLALSRGEHRRAADAVAPLFALVEARGLPEPIKAFCLPDGIEALVGCGGLERAEGLLAIYEEAGKRLQRGWVLASASRCRGLLCAARSDLDAAASAAGDAIERGRTLEFRLELGRTLLVAGQIDRRRRRKRAAADALGEALAIFEQAGARLWADRVRDELARVGLRRAAPDELTASEERVAQLAATGLTNREVAAALFMSPKTVEANLARAYRKLGIHSRAELGARIGRRDGAPASG